MLCTQSPGKGSAINQSSGANTVTEPKQILRSGVDLCDPGVSANTRQLADIIKITPVLKEIIRAKQVLATLGSANTLERVCARQDLLAAEISAGQIIQKTMLEIDFVSAEISAEQNLYAEQLATFTSDRDRLVARTNAASFYTNGTLWAVAEGLAIPTVRNPQFAVSSGITGIIAGVVPSFFSLWAMRQYSGKKRVSESDPNMLARLFDYPTSAETEYPDSVWRFLELQPLDKNGAAAKLSRKDLLIQRWVQDKNIPAFTDSTSRKQLDVLTASVPQKNGLNIETLSARLAMLEQLQGEIGKIKRLLLELVMVTSGDKQL